jgi:hypothetical protein
MPDEQHQGRPRATTSLAGALAECDLTMVIHPPHPPPGAWVVWLYPADDPAQLCIGEDAELDVAIGYAFREWDRGEVTEHAATKTPPAAAS